MSDIQLIEHLECSLIDAEYALADLTAEPDGGCPSTKAAVTSTISALKFALELLDDKNVKSVMAASRAKTIFASGRAPA